MALGQLHPDYYETGDLFFAILLHYSGYHMAKCKSAYRETTWVFLVPEHDLEILIGEYANVETSVLLTNFISSFKAVRHVSKLSYEGMGEWASSDWTKFVSSGCKH